MNYLVWELPEIETGDLAQWGKNSVGWYYGFKLHLIINDQGELLAFQLNSANIDDRQPVPDLTKHLFGHALWR